MPDTAEQKKRRYAEKKARAEKGLLTPKELEMKEKGRLLANAWYYSNPEKAKAFQNLYSREVPFMLPSSTSWHCLYQRSKKRQRITLGPENGRASRYNARSITQMMAITPKGNLLPEMQAMFSIMQYEIDARMVEIACMVSAKEQMRALLNMNRKKDVLSTVAPVWWVIKCMDKDTFFSSIWQEMASVHGQCGSSMVVHKAQFDIFFSKVQPTMVELQISVL